MFKGKPNVRLLQVALPPGGTTDWQNGRNMVDVKRVGSGLLMQTADDRVVTRGELKVVSRLAPTEAQFADVIEELLPLFPATPRGTPA